MSSLEKTWGQERWLASAYDFAVHNRLIRKVGAWVLWGLNVDRFVALVDRLQTTPAGTKLLDVPCGGGLAFASLKKDHGVDYTAFDFSPVMLKRAQQKMQELGVSGIRFQQGDVGNLPYEDGSFDLCITFNGMHCFPDPALAMREMGRVLKKGGRLRCSMAVRGQGLRYDTLIRIFQNRGWFGPTCTREELDSALQAAGLEITDSEQSGTIFLFEAVKKN